MADSQVPKPNWYLLTTEDKMIPPDAQRVMSRRAGSTVVEVKGSHAIYVSQPKAVADSHRTGCDQGQGRHREVNPRGWAHPSSVFLGGLFKFLSHVQTWSQQCLSGMWNSLVRFPSSSGTDTRWQAGCCLETTEPCARSTLRS